MSLILEALRKSEAERQIGRAPGLLTPMSMATEQRTYGRWWIVSVLVLLVTIAIVLAWWLGRNGHAGASLVNETAVSSVDAAAAISTPAVAATAAPAAVQTESPPAAAVAAPAPVVRPMPAAGPADFPSDPEFASIERESLPLPAPAAAIPAEVKLATPPPPAPAPAIVAPPTAATAPDVAPATAVPAAAAPATTPISEADAATPLRALTEAERAGLPPLRLSMHVFNPEPALRFVMIDGRRRAEGEQLTPEVKLAEIRRDGAIVDIRGRRVLIERP